MAASESSNTSGVAPSGSAAQQNEENTLQIEGQAMDVEPAAQNTSRQDYRLNFKTEAQSNEYTFAEEVPEFFSQLIIEAPEYESEDRPPVDIVAVLDVSGSMNGDRISLVRKSIRRLIRSLGSKDRVAFVTFDTNVEVVLNFCELNEINKEKAFEIIGNLTSGSQTNLSGGLEEGIQQILKNRVNEVAAVLLFTDGAANVGISSTEGIVQSVLQLVQPPLSVTNPTEIENWTVLQVCTWLKQNGLGMYETNFQQQQVDGSILKNDITPELLKYSLGVSGLHRGKFLRELAKLLGENKEQIEGQAQNTTTTKKKPEGNNRTDFRLHTFGFGANHNEDLLQKLAESTDGMYFFMENEEGIKEGFANCLGGILTTVAQNIEVKLQFNPEVTGVKLYKENVIENNGIYTVRFGDLQSEENRDILVSCTLPAKQEANEQYLIFEAAYSYQNTIANMKNEGAVQCNINRNGKIEGFSEKVDETKNREVANFALQEAIKFGDKNNLEQARVVLGEAIAKIEKSQTVNDPKCQGLLGDLRTAKGELRDKKNYKISGRKYVRQNVSSYGQQRSCNANRDNRYQYQANFSNARKSAMTSQWQARDDLDSDSEDEDNTRRQPRIQNRNQTKRAARPRLSNRSSRSSRPPVASKRGRSDPQQQRSTFVLPKRPQKRVESRSDISPSFNQLNVAQPPQTNVSTTMFLQQRFDQPPQSVRPVVKPEDTKKTNVQPPQTNVSTAVFLQQQFDQTQSVRPAEKPEDTKKTSDTQI